MKIRRKIVSIFMMLIMCFGLTLSVNAGETTLSETKFGTGFIDYCDDIYSASEYYTIYDKSDEDITKCFYQETLELYNNQNYDAIYSYMKENVSHCTKIEFTDNSLARGAIQTGTAKNSKLITVESSIKTYEAIIQLVGTFTYNANTGKISSYNSPTLSLEHVGTNNLVTGSLHSASTDAKVSSDGYKVYYSGKCYIKTTLYAPVGNVSVEVDSQVTGPYNISVTGYGQ